MGDSRRVDSIDYETGDVGEHESQHPESEKVSQHYNDGPVMSFKDLESEDEEKQKCKMWQTLFIMENHRKYGIPLPLKVQLLSLPEIKIFKVRKVW